MFTFLPARWLAALPALAAFAAGAQTGLAPNPAAGTDAAKPLSFRSAMEGYKPFVEEKPIPWKEANETVHQRGGWRAYAKESDSPPTSMPMASPPKDKP